MNIELNCLSYWFSKIRDAGLPVPKTEIVLMPRKLHKPIFQALMKGTPTGDEAKPFFTELRSAANRLGGAPIFLRTGQTSGKHSWKDTCCVTDISLLTQHVLELIEFSELCCMMGLPWDVWVLREMLPTKPVMIAERFGNMPVVREFRAFVTDGKLDCLHPYWPDEALKQGTATFSEYAAAKLNGLWHTERDEIELLACRAGAAVGGSWSVDILDTTRGWFVTDMAVASDSYHWPECERLAEAK